MLLQNIGAFELGLNNYEAASKAYREGLSYFPDNRELLYGAAFSLYSLGSVDSARKYLYTMKIPPDTTTREFKLAQLIKNHSNEK
jgi:tetratricopeptide (TPR) repeat protein